MNVDFKFSESGFLLARFFAERVSRNVEEIVNLLELLLIRNYPIVNLTIGGQI